MLKIIGYLFLMSALFVIGMRWGIVAEITALVLVIAVVLVVKK